MKQNQIDNGQKFFNIQVFGCQMNEHDSEILKGMLNQLGYDETDSIEKTDILLINTCAVREKAEHKVLGKIGTLKELKDRKPDMVIGVCGCMVQQKWMANKIKRDFPHVDLVFGTHNLHIFLDLLQEVVENGRRVFDIWDKERGIVEELPKKRSSNFKAWVVIMYGCNNFCSYCIVPYVRGRERSRHIEDIEAEIEGLARQGYKEVTLLGQNVNSYGNDKGIKGGFTSLLKRLEGLLEKKDGIQRIRFMTSHPRDFDEELVEYLGQSKRVCEHVHLPIQAGSNKILQKMNRGYTREEYLELVNKIKENIPGVSITTDIMVGFPGEDKEDFENTLDIVKRVRFDNAFTFVYSKREGTPAASMAGQVDEAVKKERIQRLIQEQQQISLENNKKLEGETVDILVEGSSKNDPGMLTGRTRTNKIVHFSLEDEKIESDKRCELNKASELTGEILKVQIKEARSYTMLGSLVDKKLNVK